MKFILTFVLTATTFASLLYGFVIAVDPYNKLGNNLFGFETKAVDFARENKFNHIEYRGKQYEAFILGSSTAHRYETMEVKKLTGLKTYNYATQSATPEDYISILRHILERQKPKLVILVMDFEVMNKNVKTDDMFYSSPLKKYLTEASPDEGTPLFSNTYLTLEAISDSFKVVWVNLFGEARHAYLEDGDHVRDPIHPHEIKITQFSYPDYQFSETRIAYLKTFKELCDQNGIRTIVLTSPYSIEHLNRILGNPHLEKKLREFKEILVNIFGELYDFETRGVAAFNDSRYFINSNHPTHDFSNMIMDHVFGKTQGPWPEDFGRKLTK